MLTNIIRRLDEDAKPDEQVYALEKRDRSRTYMIMTPKQVWKRIENSTTSHIYEVLTGACDLYLDIEWYEAAELAVPEEKKRVAAVVAHVISALQARYHETSVKVTMASASGFGSTGQYKCSWHVHLACKTVCWANALAVGQFVRDACAGIPEVDKVPYAGQGQNWRCVGSSKVTEPQRKFRPIDYSTFCGCTVQQPVGDRALIYPSETLASRCLSIPVPDHILALAALLHAGGTPSMSGDHRCVVPFKERQICEHVGRRHRSNHQYAIINTRTLLWKMGCHSCAEHIGAWRAFPCMATLCNSFACQVSTYTANAPVPATKVPAIRADSVDVNTHGPPPAGRGTVQCIDGVYASEQIECSDPRRTISLSKTAGGCNG